MKTALRISLLFGALMGYASPGLGQGSMSQFTASARDKLGKPLASPSTNGFTLSAQREFDRGVAITFSTATRYWFPDSATPGEVLVASSRYERPTLWAQALPDRSEIAIAASGRSLNGHGGLFYARNIENGLVGTSSRFDARVSLYDDGQLADWIQSNIRFARVDPVPRPLK
jgi:hypothetical protein